MRHNLVQQIIKAYEEFGAGDHRRQRRPKTARLNLQWPLKRARKRIFSLLAFPYIESSRIDFFLTSVAIVDSEIFRGSPTVRHTIIPNAMIVNRQRRVPVAIRPLQQFHERVRCELGFAPESVTIQLISDAAMARLNETYRKKHGPTDVLSFPANGTRPGQSAEYVGDIAISPETARRNARRFARTLPRKCAS